MPTSLWTWDDDPAALVDVVRRGGLVGIPSESSYGLGVDPTDARGVEAVFRVKRRPPDQALPVVLADLEQAWALGVEPGTPGLAAIASLWPAALSIVVPLRHPIAASAGDATLAIRVPDHPRLRALLRRTGPLTATSANRSGESPLLDPTALAAMLAAVDSAIERPALGAGALRWRVVDDGLLAGGPPSTLVRWQGGRFEVLRSGRFPPERLPR